jgi:hypothetical protein
LPDLASSAVSKDVPLLHILVGMTRRLHNWSYDNVTDFLRENGFSFYKEVGGSHQAWIKRGEHEVPDRIVGMHFTSKSYLLGTMKRMIRESGIEQDVWIKWGNS